MIAFVLVESGCVQNAPKYSVATEDSDPERNIREHGHFTDTLHQNAAMALSIVSASLLFVTRKLVGAVGIEKSITFKKPRK